MDDQVQKLLLNGNQLLVEKQYKDAIAAYDKAIAIDPNFAHPWNGKGNALYNLGQYKDAIAAYDQAIALDPNDALPWYGKGVVFYKLGQVEDTQPCIYRFYFVDQGKEVHRVFPTLVKFYNTRLSAPLFLFRVFQENPRLHIFFFSQSLYERTSDECREIIALIHFIQSDHCHLPDLEKLKIEGLIRHYMGDPHEASELFDTINDEAANDLMGHYYLLSSLEDYLNNTDAVLSEAIGEAQNLLNRPNHESVDKIQWYYAGHLFLLNEDYNAAFSCFKNSSQSNFLPAIYMQMLTAKRLGDIPLKVDLIEQILFEEEKLCKAGKRGIIQGIVPKSIDIDEHGWENLIFNYAYSFEVSEAILETSEWIESQTNQEEFKFSIPDLDKEKITQPLEAFNAWKLTETSKGKIEDNSSEVLGNKLTLLKIELENHFGPTIFNSLTEVPRSSDAFDRFIDGINGEKYIWEKLESLMEYCVAVGSFTSEEALLVLTFKRLKELEQKTRLKAKINFDPAIDGIAIGIATWICFVNKLHGPSVVIGVGSLPLMREFLKRIFFKDKEHKPITYYQFRDQYYDFAENLDIEKITEFTKHTDKV